MTRKLGKALKEAPELPSEIARLVYVARCTRTDLDTACEAWRLAHARLRALWGTDEIDVLTDCAIRERRAFLQDWVEGEARACRDSRG